MTLVHECAIEFIGTMFLVFVILATGNYIAIGAALAATIHLAAGISKQAFNPAVAVALTRSGALPARALMPYIMAEVGGGLAAAWMFGG